MSKFDPKCANNYMGFWCVQLEWFNPMFNAVITGRAAQFEVDDAPPKYSIVGAGVAVIPIVGMMMKGQSKFGGTSTVNTRRLLREAVGDESVKSILLRIDSPGGTTAGTEELASDILSLRNKKPIVAHIEDSGMSAAYWVASQANKIYANKTAWVGSIGTFASVTDSSGAAEKEGIKVHVISTGWMKGAGEPGTKITQEQLDYLQSKVNELNSFFLDGIKQSRENVDIKAVSTGEWWIAKEAKSLKLIDGVQSLEETIAALSEKYGARNKLKSAEMRMRISG